MSTTRRRWMTGLLAVSLALNVFVGAFFLGRIVFDDGRHHDHDGRRYTMRLELKALSKALPEAARDALHAQLRARGEEMRPVFRDIRQSRRDIVALLAEERLDEAALDREFDALRRSLATVHEALQEIIFNAARDMTPEQRQRMARVLQRIHERGRNGEDEREEAGENRNGQR